MLAYRSCFTNIAENGAIYIYKIIPHLELTAVILNQYMLSHRGDKAARES